MAGQTAAAGGPTWRDLSDKNDQLRVELTEKIDDVAVKVDHVADTLSEVKDALLPRVAVVEAAVVAHTAQIADHDIRIGNLETAHNRALGHIGAWKILGGVAGGSAAIVVADLLAHAFGL